MSSTQDGAKATDTSVTTGMVADALWLNFGLEDIFITNCVKDACQSNVEAAALS